MNELLYSMFSYVTVASSYLSLCFVLFVCEFICVNFNDQFVIEAVQVCLDGLLEHVRNVVGECNFKVKVARY